MWAKTDNRQWPHGARSAVAPLVLVALVALFALNPWPGAQAASDNASRAQQEPAGSGRANNRVEVEIAGAKVALDGADGELAQQLASRYLSTEFTVQGPDMALRTSRAQLGVKVDLNRLADLLGRAADPGSPLRRYHRLLRPSQPLRLPMPIDLDVDETMAWLKRLKDASDRPARSAQINPRRRARVAAVPGRTLDLVASLAALRAAFAAGALEAPAVMRTVSPKRDLDDLQDVALDAVLAGFETPYSLQKKARARTHNLKIAAAKLDGWVVPAGAIFDFNEVVGDRTRLNGFKPAPEISSGRLVEGMGGGTCQVASTLHGAAFFAGLPILTRHPHSRPSGYIKLGLDAAVAYGSLNFRFRNDRDFPLVLGVVVKDGRLRASIYGARQDRTVTFVRRIERALPFEVELIEDAQLPRGLRVLSQRGVAGFEVTRFRAVQQQGGHGQRQRSTDVYPPTPQIWRIGTGPEATADYQPPKNDPHPEYVADEYLRAVQRPGRPTLDITRRPGRYGTYGWTEREGLMVEPETASTSPSPEGPQAR